MLGQLSQRTSSFGLQSMLSREAQKQSLIKSKDSLTAYLAEESRYATNDTIGAVVGGWCNNQTILFVVGVLVIEILLLPQDWLMVDQGCTHLGLLWRGQ